MSDYMFVLDSHLDAGQNNAVTEIQKIATLAGLNVWLTGGAMRDMLRGAPIRDLDFTVERDASKIGKQLAQALGGSIVGEDPLKRFLELELPGHVRASVNNSRVEKYSRAGKKPHIEPASIHEDLSRRDFTINAIALSLNRGSRGLLVDPVNGQADLVSRELRTTNSYSFFDDPSRIFRLIRLHHMLGFEPVERTKMQLENALMEEYQKLVPASALAHEIRIMAMQPNVVAMIEAFETHGLLKLLAPGLTLAKLNTQGLARFEKLVTAVLPPGAGDGFAAFLHVLTEKLNTRERAEVVRAFELSAAETAMLKKLDAQAKKLESTLKSARITRPSHVWEALHGATTAEILMVLYTSQARVVQDRIRAYYTKYLQTAQEVTPDQMDSKAGAPGTPKYEKAWRALVTQRLNARPKKVVAPEPEPPPMAMTGGRGRRAASS